MKFWIDHFKYDAIFTVVALALCYAIGGPTGLFEGFVLGIMEISLSFDNAVVNATVLRDMDEKWRKRFLLWGILIAVVGMRLIFPVLVVSVTSGLNPLAVANLALHSPKDYAAELTSAHVQIAGFGGAFLFMIFWKFFIDEEKDSHWIGFIESKLINLARIEMVQVALTLVTAALFTLAIPDGDKAHFLLAAVCGVVANIVVEGLGNFVNVEDAGVKVAKAGLASFLYLEMVDASFSFDGVIGAFAISTDVFIIALGLGIGAMFVRSLTLVMVEREALDGLRYLEHGAFWAIGALATIMFVTAFHEVPEAVTGLIGAGLIAVAVVHSLIAAKRDKAGEAVAE